MDRRSLFKAFSSILKDANKKQVLIKPPYFKDFSFFDKICPDCENKCDSVCQEEIIKIDQYKIPYLDFSKSGCTYCEECLNICEILTNKEQKIEAKIEINLVKCLSWNETMCFSCKDACSYRAIDFLGLFRPQINKQCTNCGFCIGICPTGAILAK